MRREGKKKAKDIKMARFTIVSVYQQSSHVEDYVPFLVQLLCLSMVSQQSRILRYMYIYYINRKNTEVEAAASCQY